MRNQFIVLFGFLMAACTPQSTPISPSTDLVTFPSATTTPTATAEIDTDQIKSAAIADLSNRLSLGPKLILVTSIESQLWPDSSLGCPQVGKEYAQQTVPGYRIQLEANGVGYIYHTDTKNTVILCTDDDLPSFPVTPGEIDDAEPWMPVE